MNPTTLHSTVLRNTLLTLVLATCAWVPARAILPEGGLDSSLPIDPAVLEEIAAGAATAAIIVETTGDPGPVAAYAEFLGMEVTWVYSIIDAFAGTATAAQLEILAADPGVAYVHSDQPVGPVMGTSHQAIEADRAWEAELRGDGITVAILDTGIDELNPFFAGAIVSCISVLSGVVLPECVDTDGHGTHVAGTVASRDDRYPGVAPAASLAIVRVLHGGVGLTSDVIAGMEWVRDNQGDVEPPIRVANMSLGPLTPGCGSDANPSAQAANSMVESGLFVAVAAGNSGHDTCTIDGAGAASRVATIAAVDDRGTVTQEDDVIAGFSSGGGGVLAKPDVAFPGVSITSAFIGGGTLIATMSGTSMASPHAAGTAALLLEQDGSRTPDEVKEIMASSALKTANTGDSWNDVYGHGLGNACRALGLQTCTFPMEPPPPPEPFELSATGYRVQGSHHADLSWSGATSAEVDVLRDGTLVATTANDGAFTDAIGTKGKGAYAYQVCEAGTTVCSNPVAVAF